MLANSTLLLLGCLDFKLIMDNIGILGFLSMVYDLKVETYDLNFNFHIL